MRVFVTGTGRCGTTTFKEACRHITNYTAGHETNRHKADMNNLEYPDNHIEVDPHLWAMLPLLEKKYPRSCYVHIRRNRAEVIESWWKREANQLPGSGLGLASLAAPFVQLNVNNLKSQHQFYPAAKLMYDVITSNIDHFLQNTRVNSCITLQLGLITVAEWRNFWDLIGAEGDFVASCQTWDTVHNAGAT
jgi:hypothetical protein